MTGPGRDRLGLVEGLDRFIEHHMDGAEPAHELEQDAADADQERQRPVAPPSAATPCPGYWAGAASSELAKGLDARSRSGHGLIGV